MNTLISDYREILYEQDDFPERELSALLASKVTCQVDISLWTKQ